ncbi:MAG: FAD-dependent oxidoreductase [Peptococcaceae bacterium]|jgi:2,4-dienoyl-CoA reductase-like NADH-dependent reductase (Old Yellow Enzyme family)/thioredoxin reductase|nr:NAD(P)/FAD-dependent oxidoreductase [Peptococcaceae bacterium]MDH7526399.1 FAD-dependent oxidoreductase [Peptococcaceae bacterium]
MATVYDPIKIGNMVVKNRFVEAPTVKNFADVDGRVNSRTLNNFELEADGPGLIIVTMTFTENQGQVFRQQLGIQDSKAVAGMSDLADRIHKAGAKAALQISHGGNLCSAEIIGETPVGPSEKPQWSGQKVKALTTAEVEKIIDNYGKATARAIQAGFDAVELHSCHGSLALQFLSPLHNIGRTDKYAVRTTFLYETVETMMKYAGPGFPIGVRLSCHEFMQEDLGTPGLEFSEVLEEIVPTLEKMGVAWIHASAGRIGHTPDHAFPPLYEPRGVNVRFAEAIKKKVKIPVITVGRLQDPKLVENIIAEGKADLVAMCRPIIAEPHFAKKMIEGRFEDIRQCMGCNWCLNRLFLSLGCECPMNPAYSWEEEYALKPVKEPKKVMVVGGGVGGLQAALTAAQRGHQVTLYEKSGKLGGQTKLASAFPRLYTRELWNLPKWLIRECEKAGVKCVLNVEVTKELVEKEKPDVVVVATGAKEKKADLPANGMKIVYLWEYLEGKAEIGKKVVILGGNEGAEAAVSLAREGKEVTLVEEGEKIAAAAYLYPYAARLQPLMRYLKEEKVAILTQRKVRSMSQGYVVLEGPDGQERIPADTVVVALGRESNDALYQEIAERGKAVYLIGDAKEVRSMVSATHEGFYVGRKM